MHIHSRPLSSKNDLRDDFIETLELDLIGPSDIHEQSLEPPHKRYEIGILWPNKSNQIFEQEDDIENPSQIDNTERDDEETPIINNTDFSSKSIGISVKPQINDILELEFTFGVYLKNKVDHKLNQFTKSTNQQIKLNHLVIFNLDKGAYLNESYNGIEASILFDILKSKFDFPLKNHFINNQIQTVITHEKTNSLTNEIEKEEKNCLQYNVGQIYSELFSENNPSITVEIHKKFDPELSKLNNYLIKLV